MEHGSNNKTLLNFAILCPLFLVFSLLLSKWYDGRGMDFSQYWQAGHMILAGQNVYDSVQWVAVHQLEGIAFHTGPPFLYPLPLAVLFSPLALLPLKSLYILWMFFAQIAVLVSIVILLSFYPARSGYLELLTIAGIFFFRPMFSDINSGQIITPLLLVLVLSIRLFHNGKWFAGGLILSILSLKPSVGFPILVLTGIWLLIRKQWRGVWGMMAGGLVLVMIGALVNPQWIIEYLHVGGNSFLRNFGLQPTLWGVVGKIFKIHSLSLTIGLICSAVILVIEVYLFWRDKSKVEVLPAFASILPAALLIAPYSWNYDQILLTIPIVFLLITISVKYGTWKAVLFMFGIVALSLGLVAIAYVVKHDVWSFLNSFVVWIFTLYFVTKRSQLQTG